MEKEERLDMWETYLTELRDDLVFFSEQLGLYPTVRQKHFLASSKKEGSQLTAFDTAYLSYLDAITMPLVLNNLLCGNPETYVVFPNVARAKIWMSRLQGLIGRSPIKKLVKYPGLRHIEIGQRRASLGTGILSNSNRENTVGLHQRGYDLVLIDPCEESRSWIQFTEDISIDPRRVWSLGVRALDPFPDIKKVNRHYL